jgi:hypothetical protein
VLRKAREPAWILGSSPDTNKRSTLGCLLDLPRRPGLPQRPWSPSSKRHSGPWPHPLAAGRVLEGFADAMMLANGSAVEALRGLRSTRGVRAA